MCDRIYLCHICFWPICFPFGQKMHIGTGWYCWREYGGGHDERLDALRPFVFSTDRERLATLVERAVKLYGYWKEDRKRREVIQVIRQNLRAGHTDVVHEFLRRVHRDEEIGAFLKELTGTEEWRRWSRGAVP